MILAVGTGAGGGFYSGPVDLLYYNPNSLEWTSFASPSSGSNLVYPNAVFSPSLAYDSVNNILYLGYANVNDNTLVLCKTSNVSTPLTCNLLPESGGMNFNPGMAVFNNTLYIAFESQANSHDLELYTSTDHGQSIQANNGLGSAQDQDQTSVAPFVLNFNNKALYVGFRTNDSNQYFVNRYSTDGVNFSSDETINNPWPIGSTPALVDGNQLSNPQNVVYNLFGSNDGNANLYTFIGQF